MFSALELTISVVKCRQKTETLSSRLMQCEETRSRKYVVRVVWISSLYFKALLSTVVMMHQLFLCIFVFMRISPSQLYPMVPLRVGIRSVVLSVWWLLSKWFRLHGRYSRRVYIMEMTTIMLYCICSTQ